MMKGFRTASGERAFCVESYIGRPPIETVSPEEYENPEHEP